MVVVVLIIVSFEYCSTNRFPSTLKSLPIVTLLFAEISPLTSTLLIVANPVTPNVPPTVVLPVVPATVNLSVLTAISPVTPNVPATDVLPVAAATVNLSVFTATSPNIAVFPLTAVTANLSVFTVKSPVLSNAPPTEAPEATDKPVPVDLLIVTVSLNDPVPATVRF